MKRLIGLMRRIFYPITCFCFKFNHDTISNTNELCCHLQKIALQCTENLGFYLVDNIILEYHKYSVSRKHAANLANN